MKVLFWVGLVLLVVGVASLFVKLPQPQQVTGHVVSYTVRIVVFLTGLSCLLAGAVAREPV